MAKLRPIDGQTLHQHRYRAGGGSPFRTPRVHPCEITCVSFHKKGEGESERERDCQQDADNGDDPILPPRQPRSREISLLPIQRIRALPTRVSRRVTTPFLRVPRKRGRETTKLPRVSLSLSLYLSSLSGSSTIFPDSSRSIITFSSFLLASSKTTTRSRIEEDVVSSCPCPAHQEESSDSNTLLVRIVTRYSGGDSFQFPFLPFWINAILASRKSRNREGLNCGKLIQRNRSQ